MTGSRLRLYALPILALAGATAMIVSLRSEHGRLLAERDALTVQVKAAAAVRTPEPPHARSRSPDVDSDEAVAVARLRQELERLRRQIAQRERALRGRAHAAPRDGAASPRSIVEESVASAGWRNAGQADPVAAVETALWAAAGGEIDHLAAVLTVGTAADPLADLFARLPPDLRAEYGNPLRLLALLTSVDVPLTAARLTAFDTGETDRRLIIATLDMPDQTPRIVELNTMRDPGDGRWRIVVPAAALARYHDRLSGATAPAATSTPGAGKAG